MSTLNIGEYGVACLLNVSYPLSNATSLTLAFTRPDKSTFSATGEQVTAPGADLAVAGQGTYAAGQYARYVFADGDLNQAGAYTVRLVYVDASPKRLVSDVASFTVNP